MTPRLAYDDAGSSGRIKRKPSPKSAFIRAKKAEETYARHLRRIARVVGDYVTGLFNPDDPASLGKIEAGLKRYADTLGHWAESVGQKMLTEVAARDRKAWMSVAKELGRTLHKEIDEAPTGIVMRQRLADQVSLIKSLPLEAAERVRNLATEGITTGTRASEIAAEIMRSGEVTKSRANTIARTEVSRTATELTRARAEAIGSTGYVWRTSGDSDVRASHRKMAGRFVAWGSPPTLDGLTGHAGSLPNCRCYAEPVIPDE